MNIEVIMSAYNNVEDLKLVLEGFKNQTDDNFSLCIADDGSTDELANLLTEFKHAPFSIRHIWHEDKGFRRAAILNKALASSTADYIIFTDSDCIPAINFIADHHHLASLNHYTVGIRVYLKEKLSQDIRNGTLPATQLKNTCYLLLQSIRGNVSKPEQAIYFPDWSLSIVKKLKPNLTRFGSNLAMSRESLLKINGFDEDFEGWGYEDTDLLWRIEQIGLTPRGYLGRCRQYHLNHKTQPPNQNGRNLFLKKKENNIIACANGINKA
ncbi:MULTISPECIES: glycosyltransferase [Photobacterium]|jgi:glycosyltransferase involved in cell wall biosynthesis|uniref:glycosyltransferase n=1 Tax=Photobacterium TaxID=657 RepID=UPI0005D31D69|nr:MULTISPECIES: glycosyltransferase [Photobacterium]KJG14040.1 glycosyl transferase [Photobacterium iliopiscarium]